MKKEWRKLDSYGKIFPLVETERNTAVFRITIFMNLIVSPQKLKKALILTLDKFQDFKVTMKKGFFKYYLQVINNDVVVKKDQNDSCTKIDLAKNNGYLFRVTYNENRINIDFYHILTDGTGASLFAKELVEHYIDLIKGANINTSLLLPCHDCYKKSTTIKVDKVSKRKNPSGKSYIVKNEFLPKGSSITNITTDLKEITALCKRNNLTITQYIVSLVAKSIYETNEQKMKQKERIKISIPVNLRNYFKFETVSNFFDYFNVSISKTEAAEELKKLTLRVRNIFQEELIREKFISRVRQNAALLNQRFSKLIPINIKKPIASFFYKTFVESSTVILSNIGQISFQEEYNKYVDNVIFVLNPEEKTIKCSICSTNNKLSINFATYFKDNNIEKKCCEFLKRDGLNILFEKKYI